MSLNKSYYLLLLFFLLQCTNNHVPIPEGVTIREIGGRYMVLKDGKEVEIKGVSGYDYLKEAKEVGATVIRTWDEVNAQAILDSAFKNQLYVVLGIHLPKPRNGHDYSSKDFISIQKNRITSIVNKYKGHPALLFWAVGNEVEHYPTNYIIWKQLNNFINLVKSIDDSHPVTTMITPFRKCVAYSKFFLRDLDLLSINAFGAINEIEDKLNMPIIGWSGPFMITEWGTNGPWEELEKTKWGAPIEKNSSKKAEIIRYRYNDIFLNSIENNIGGFIFYWGYRHQYTNTWFSIFSENGHKSEVYYEMNNLWNKPSEQNLPPLVKGIFLDEKSAYDNIILKKGRVYNSLVEVKDSDSLIFSWKIIKDNIYLEESDFLIVNEPKEEQVDFDLLDNTSAFELKLENGPYRLFVEIFDGNNNFAYANIPFYLLD